jgi:hypothetical protein
MHEIKLAIVKNEHNKMQKVALVYFEIELQNSHRETWPLC